MESKKAKWGDQVLFSGGDKAVQLTIPFKFVPEFHLDDFILCQCNIDSHKAIYNNDLWPDKRLLIIGKSGSGKTHLVNIWAKLNDAEVLDPASGVAPSFSKALALENIDEFDAHKLFHYLNHAHQHGLSVLMTARVLKQYSLPDLNSRVNSCYKTIIKEPSISLLKVILMKHFYDRQLKVNQDVLDYIVVRMERSFSYVKILVSQLDRASAEERRNLTIPFVRKIIANTLVEQMDD